LNIDPLLPEILEQLRQGYREDLMVIWRWPLVRTGLLTR
jgi:hypothetical protein